MTTIKVFDGAIWQTTSLPISSGGGGDVHVGPDAPPGTPDSGDIWFDTDDPGYIPLPLAINSGGTQASSAFSARANLAVPGIGNSTTTAGAPTSGTWARGDQWLDSTNVVWTCTVAGTPGTWGYSTPRVLAYVEGQASTAIVGQTTLLTTPPITLPAGRRIEMSGYVSLVTTTAGATAQVVARDTGNSMTSNTVDTMNAGNNRTVPIGRVVATSTAGTFTWILRVDLLSGSTLTVYGNNTHWLKIVDLGPP